MGINQLNIFTNLLDNSKPDNTTYSRAKFINYLTTKRGIVILNLNDWRDRIIHLFNPDTKLEAFLHAAPGDDRIEYATIYRTMKKLGLDDLPGNKELV